ncbi:hypothetical protein BCR39DRAFT_187378 [Naematelia encephala]|uniref:GST N-terminal domain-containing protein n=1 Tax=Naematelia encephala TaxID=71784 RepID=A0A1Y2B406_9TREE|nr:hypothetical protein BCR39DRAFT_187378 [Naematelia encephala]
MADPASLSESGLPPCLDISKSCVLYTQWRSSSSMRVRISLEFKRLCPSVHTIDLDNIPEGYKVLNPSLSVPSFVVDGVLMTQSLAISEYLEDRWPDRGLGRLLPERADQRAAVRAVCCSVDTAGAESSDTTCSKAPSFA